MINEQEKEASSMTADPIDTAVDSQQAHTAAASSTEGVFASLGLNVQGFGSQLFNFVLVAVILWFLILKPLTKKMTERQAIIDESLDNAVKVQKNLEESEKQFNAKINEAKAEASRLLEKAHADAVILSNQMQADTKIEIEALVEKAKKNIRIEKEDMVAGLKKETVDLVITVVEKVLAEKMNSAKDAEMISEMIAKIK